MSLEGRDLSDTQILDATQMEHDAEKDAHRLAIKLPSGRTLYSDYGPAEELRKRLIPWCESVRSAIDSDILQAKEEQKVAIGRASMSEPPVLEEITALGPEEHAEKQRRHWEAVYNSLLSQYERIAAEMSDANRKRMQWLRVQEALKEDGE